MKEISLRCLYTHKASGDVYATKCWVMNKTNDIEMVEYVQVRFYEKHRGHDIRQKTVRKSKEAYRYVCELDDFSEKFRPATKDDIERVLKEKY